MHLAMLVLGITILGGLTIDNAFAVDMFLKIDDLKGEVDDRGHEDEIEVLSWSWGMSQSGDSSTGRATGTTSVNEVTITKLVDNTSTDLYSVCCTGDHFTEAKLSVRRAGGEPLDYLVITMSDVSVSSVSVTGKAGEEILKETITLNFDKIKIDYTPQNEDGSPSGPMQTATINKFPGRR